MHWHFLSFYLFSIIQTSIWLCILALISSSRAVAPNLSTSQPLSLILRVQLDFSFAASRLLPVSAVSPLLKFTVLGKCSEPADFSWFFHFLGDFGFRRLPLSTPTCFCHHLLLSHIFLFTFSFLFSDNTCFHDFAVSLARYLRLLCSVENFHPTFSSSLARGYLNPRSVSVSAIWQFELEYLAYLSGSRTSYHDRTIR